MKLTPEQLIAISAGCKKASDLAGVAQALSTAMTDGGIATVTRAAAFLAQVLWESGSFRYAEEIASGTAYEGRKDLGNTQPGDGARYKGRGWIQLTGRANYRAAGQALGLDLETLPHLAASPGVSARVAVWYWNSRKLSECADAWDFAGVTKGVNGAATDGPPSHHGKRLLLYQRVLEVLGRTSSVT